MNPNVMRPLSRLALALPFFVIGSHSALGDSWPQFRGPTGQGQSLAENLPVTWGGPAADNVLWKSPLKGDGHASPIVWEDRVFVCTAYWPEDAKTEAQRKAVIPEQHVMCFRLSDGQQLWDTQIPPGPWKREDFRSGSGGGYAAPTPATDGKHLYVVFGSSVIAAVDFEGQIVWRKEITPHTFDVTIGSSPVLFGDNVLMLCAMSNKQDSKLVAYDKRDGAIRWEKALPETGFAHSTPLLIEKDTKPQLIIVASGVGTTKSGVMSLHPANGDILWTCAGAGDAASPAYGAGVVYSDSGRGGPGLAIDPKGTGDVSSTHVKWRINQVPEGIGSPLIVNGLIYRLHRPNVLKCWRAEDGSEVYTERLEKLSTTWASPVVDAKGRIFIANAGVSYVIQSGEKFQVLSINDLGDPNHASPAVADGKMILVGINNVYCIGE